MEQDELIKTVLSAQTGNAEAHGKLYEAFRDMVYSKNPLPSIPPRKRNVLRHKQRLSGVIVQSP